MVEILRAEQAHREVTLPSAVSGQLRTSSGKGYEVSSSSAALALEGEGLIPCGEEVANAPLLAEHTFADLTHFLALQGAIQEFLTQLEQPALQDAIQPSPSPSSAEPKPTKPAVSLAQQPLLAAMATRVPASTIPLSSKNTAPQNHPPASASPTPKATPLGEGTRMAKLPTEGVVSRSAAALPEALSEGRWERESHERDQGQQGGHHEESEEETEDSHHQEEAHEAKQKVSSVTRITPPSASHTHAPAKRHASHVAYATPAAPSAPGALRGIENIYIRFMALMARILGQAEAEAHELYQRIKERTDTIDFLTFAVSKINAEKGAIDWTKDAEMQQLIEKLRNLGVEIPAGKYKWSEDEKRLLKENIQMKKEGMEKISQLERTDMQRYLQEASQCHQARSNILKLLKEVMDTITHNMRP